MPEVTIKPADPIVPGRPTTDALFPLAKLAAPILASLTDGTPGFAHGGGMVPDEGREGAIFVDHLRPGWVHFVLRLPEQGMGTLHVPASQVSLRIDPHAGQAESARIAARILGASEEEACGAFWHCTTPWVHPDGHTCPAKVWLFAPIDYRGHASWPTAEDVRTPTGRADAILAVMERLCGVRDGE